MSRHESDGKTQSQSDSTAKNPEEEDISQLAHLKNALPSSCAFFWSTHQHWDSERTKHERPYTHPSQSDWNSDSNRDDIPKHARILLPFSQ